MKETCPKCGKNIEEKENLCSNCGHPLTETESEKQKTQAASETTEKDSATEEKSEPSFTPESDESIEWSDLKDMSLGHVMELFNEQNNEETEKLPIEATDINQADPALAEVSDHSAEKKSETTSEQATETTSELPIEAPTPKTIEKETVVFEEQSTEPSVQETSAETEDANEEDFAELTPNEMLQAYILAHKNDRAKQERTAANEGDLSTPAETTETAPEAEKEPAEELLTADESKATTLPAEAIADTKEDAKEKAEDKEETPPEESENTATLKRNAAPFEFDEVPNFYTEEAAETTDEPVQVSESHSAPKKSYKKITVAAVAVMALAMGGWVIYHTQQPAAEKQTTQTSDSSAKELTDQIQEQIDSYFMTEKKIYLKPEMVSADTAKIKENIEKLTDSKKSAALTKQLQAVEAKRTRIAAVNQLFDKAIIDGDKLTEANLAADQPIKLEKSKEKDAFNDLMNQAIDRAQQQYDQLQKAKQAVAAIYQNGKETSALTRATYTTAKNEVDAVKSAALKQNLATQLEQAEKVLVAAETAAQAATAPKVEPNGYSAPNSEGVYTDPLYIADPKDVADTTNPAWTWNPGVKEKVIATAIERGYIVEGGYRLEPAKIVNGEGYYNLYATNNQSPLLKGYPDGELHVYLITINDKTGWFKGNASRNAGR